MELKERINQALKQAMLDRDEVRRNTIRMLLTAIKNKEKELRRELEEIEIQQAIAGGIKQRRDSVEQYRKGDREDLAAAEEKEIGILQEFLPRPLSQGELETLIEQAVNETGARSVKDMGKVMKWIMPRVTGRVEGKTVNEMVRKRLC